MLYIISEALLHLVEQAMGRIRKHSLPLVFPLIILSFYIHVKIAAVPLVAADPISLFKAACVSMEMFLDNTHHIDDVDCAAYSRRRRRV